MQVCEYQCYDQFCILLGVGDDDGVDDYVLVDDLVEIEVFLVELLYCVLQVVVGIEYLLLDQFGCDEGYCVGIEEGGVQYVFVVYFLVDEDGQQEVQQYGCDDVEYVIDGQVVDGQLLVFVVEQVFELLQVDEVVVGEGVGVGY